MEADILKTLVEIKDILNTDSSGWMPALFTLLGVFIAGFWQYLNSKINLQALSETKELEIKSEVISKQRQQWMDQIREISSGFLAEYDVIVGDLGNDRFAQEEHDALYKSSNEKANLIVLMLNLNKPSQKKAAMAIASIQAIVKTFQENGGDAARKKYDIHRNDFTQALLVVFGETWQKIKRLE